MGRARRFRAELNSSQAELSWANIVSSQKYLNPLPSKASLSQRLIVYQAEPWLDPPLLSSSTAVWSLWGCHFYLEIRGQSQDLAKNSLYSRCNYSFSHSTSVFSFGSSLERHRIKLSFLNLLLSKTISFSEKLDQIQCYVAAVGTWKVATVLRKTFRSLSSHDGTKSSQIAQLSQNSC